MHRGPKIVFINITSSRVLLLHLDLSSDSFLLFIILICHLFRLNIFSDWLVFKFILVILVCIILCMRHLVNLRAIFLWLFTTTSLCRWYVLLINILVLDILNIYWLLALIIIVVCKLRFTLLLSNLALLLNLLLSTWRRLIDWVIDFNIVVKDLLLSALSDGVAQLLLV